MMANNICCGTNPTNTTATILSLCHSVPPLVSDAAFFLSLPKFRVPLEVDLESIAALAQVGGVMVEIIAAVAVAMVLALILLVAAAVVVVAVVTTRVFAVMTNALTC